MQMNKHYSYNIHCASMFGNLFGRINVLSYQSFSFLHAGCHICHIFLTGFNLKYKWFVKNDTNKNIQIRIYESIT